MQKCRIQIGEDGELEDCYERWGLVYVKSDQYVGPPDKGFARSSYAEEPGEHLDPRTVSDAFDFKITFVAEAIRGQLKRPNPNLLRGSQLFENIADRSWTIPQLNQIVTADLYNGCQIIKSQGLKNFGVYQSVTDVEVGEWLTFSAWVKVAMNSNGVIEVVVPPSLPGNTSPNAIDITDIVSSGKWKRVSVTFKVMSLNQPLCCRIESSVDGNVIYMAGPKLERGKLSTPYVPYVGESNYERYAEIGSITSPKHVNTIIKSLNDAMFIKDPNNGMMLAQRVIVHDDFKHRRIKGYPKPISLPEDDDLFYSNGHELALIGLTLRVDNPDACNFDVHEDGIGSMVIGENFVVS